MKTIFILILICIAGSSLSAQMTYVPDDKFEQALIDLGYDTSPLNDSIPTKNIDTVTILDVSSKNINNLKGIEDFKALEWLFCSWNSLTSLDLSKNTALERLDCYWNSLTSLDVSGCTALTWLSCFVNTLTSLDVSKNTALEVLHCYNTALTSLDVSKNTALTWLWCNNNTLTSLNVSNNTDLEVLYCHFNALTSLNVSGCTALTYLNCNYNELANLDISENSVMTYLYCWDNNLTSLDVSKNTALTYLNCYENPSLYCIQVADSVKAANNSDWRKDGHAVWSEDCGYVSVEEEINSKNIITLSPNPAGDYVDISGVLGDVKMFDVLGIEHPATAWHPSEEGNIRIDISSLSPGVYFVRIGSYFAKFVKI